MSSAPLPLESLDLDITPKTTHNITWSPDAELAIACDDSVLVYVPDFNQVRVPDHNNTNTNPHPNPTTRSSTSLLHLHLHFQHALTNQPRQYDEAALRFPTAPLRPFDANLNRHLFDEAGQEFAGFAHFTGAGRGVITGHGSTLNHTVSLAWSPCGLGRANRACLAVLTAAGVVSVYCQGAEEGEGGGGRGGGGGGGARGLKPWVAAWHVGAGLLVPALTVEVEGEVKGKGMGMGEDPEAPGKKECITAFAWARDVQAGGVALMGYLNDEKEVVLLLVRARHGVKDEGGHPGIWTVREVARFRAEGPHGNGMGVDPTDPDHIHCASSFALSWSPWLRAGTSRTAVLSYVAHNYVGFRQVTLDDPDHAFGLNGSELSLPSVRVARADASGVCLYLSTDAFVTWEDRIWTVPGANLCRGVIASPTKVQAFELPFHNISPVPKHLTDECGTTYPSEEDLAHMGNPITGLIIHPPSFSNDTATPSYTLVRLSASHDTPAWHQTNLLLPRPPNTFAHDGDVSMGMGIGVGVGMTEEDPQNPNLNFNFQWATDIGQIIEHKLPRTLAYRHQTDAGGDRNGAGGNNDAAVAAFESDDDDDDSDDSDVFGDYSDDDDDDNNGNGNENGTAGKGKGKGKGKESRDNGDEGDVLPAMFRGIDTEDQVHLSRVRIWGLAASPGGGTAAVLVSLHSSLELERDTFAGLNVRVLFGATPRVEWGEQNQHQNQSQNQSYGYGAEDLQHCSTEARAWEWMYGGAPPVPGYSAPPQLDDARASGLVRAEFRHVAQGMRCVFCEGRLRLVDGDDASVCKRGHCFENCANTGVPIVAPNISRTCGVCGLKSLKSEELLAREPNLKESVRMSILAQLCGRCGGKFTN
ncbi:hypothetical protein F4808DRAFT_462288 [Astrocystis sublimbata]|nr:hypothetical protein F4808DRAFT_462288 [Astrocystis sublimbata]